MGCGSYSLAKAMISSLLTVRPPHSMTSPAWKSSKYLRKRATPPQASTRARDRFHCDGSKAKHFARLGRGCRLCAKLANQPDETRNQLLIRRQFAAAHIPVVLEADTRVPAKNDRIRSRIELDV